jgi:hypothetical protein
MKTVEKVLIGITLLGLIIKLLHWPGGSILMILGLSILAFFYPIAAYFLFSPVKYFEVDGMTFTETSAPRVILSLGTGFCLPVAVIGLLFRFMHWPGAKMMLLIGLVTIVPIAIVSLVKHSVTKDNFYKQIAIRTIVVASLALLLFTFVVLPLNSKG